MGDRLRSRLSFDALEHKGWRERYYWLLLAEGASEPQAVLGRC